MHRLIIAISISVAIVVACGLYQEFNVRRLISEVNKSEVESRAPIKTSSLRFKPSPKNNDTGSIEESSVSEIRKDISSITSEDYVNEILQDLEEEECCPEESEVLPKDKSLARSLTAYEREKERLLEEHGDTYEVSAYLRLLRKEAARERVSTVEELLEFYRLHAHFNPEPENVAGYENARRIYGKYNPNATIVKAYMTQPLRVGDTFRLSEEDSELLLDAALNR